MRTGVSRADPLRPPLRRAWTRPLDGAVYAQPLVIGDRLVAATERNTVYALNAVTGRQVWKRHLGSPVPLGDLPCGNIDPLGITGTPAYDAQSGNVFLVTETTGAHHTLHALDLRTGRVRWHRDLDVYPSRDRAAEQQRSALLLTHGHVYVAFGGLFGDCGNYVGYVAAVDTDGTGPVLRYAVPTAREAGIWSPAGPVQDKTQTDIFVASGNGAEVGGDYDGSDSVIRLTPALHKVALFAPSTWSADNAADLDLGSSSPVPTPSGQIVIAGKRGTVYLLDAGLGGVGGERATLDGCAAYGGAALAQPQVILMPCSDGVRRLNLRKHSMHWSWRLDGVAGSPTVAGGVLYALNQDSGELVEASVDSGHVQARVSVGEVSRFATPVPVGSLVYVGTDHGIVAVRGSAA
jgi:outer membrane protein assembly factor BamB